MDLWTDTVWRQFAAAIDMMDHAIAACPDRVWDDGATPPNLVWYSAFHAAFFLDLYLSGSVEGFAPPAPFTMSEADPRGVMPERTYTKEELRTYLAHSRAKCRGVMEALTEERARRRHRFPWGELTFAELLLDNLRHVQHHAAQINLLLRQKADVGSPWIATTRKP
jgi:hypothetical protein